MMRRVLFLLAFCAALTIVGAAQKDFGADWFNTGTNQEKTNRLASIGVDKKIAEAFFQDSRKPSPKWADLASMAGTDRALIFLPCSSLDRAYIYLMAKQTGRWSITDWNSFDCHYDESVAFTVEHLRSSHIDEIFVHHACEGHGTGYLQQDFFIFEARNGKLREIMDAAEVLRAYPVDGSPQIEQSSRFQIIPSDHSSSKQIEEIRTKRISRRTDFSEGGSTQAISHTKVQRRIFRWDSKRRRYIASPYAAVQGSTIQSKLQ